MKGTLQSFVALFHVWRLCRRMERGEQANIETLCYLVGWYLWTLEE